MKSVAKNRETISAGGQEFSDRKQSGGTGKERDQRLFRSLLSLVLVSLFYVFYVYPRACHCVFFSIDQINKHASNGALR